MSDKTELRPFGGTIVGGVATSGGVHYETTTLDVLLRHTGLDLSEPIPFGLGSGLSFVHWDSKRQEPPFLGGRVKPLVLTQNLTRCLGIELREQETVSARKAWDRVRSSIDGGTPVRLQLNSHYLECFGSRAHFAGHLVAMYGYDTERVYLVDTTQQGGAVSISPESLARARAVRGPTLARHRSFTLAASDVDAEHLASVVIPAITEYAEVFLTSPIANLGSRGIRTAIARVRTWFGRVEDPGRDLAVIAMMMRRADTGGAPFRNLYRDFLVECREPLDDEASTNLVGRGKDLFAESAVFWTEVAELIQEVSVTGGPDRLAWVGRLLEDIATIEASAMTVLSFLTPSVPGNHT